MYDDIARELSFVSKNKRRRKERTIEIDDREDRDRLTQLLLGGLGYSTPVVRLPLGDFRWESPLGIVLVERKTPRDITDLDRTASQLNRLRAAAKEGVFPILLVDHVPARRDSNYRTWADDAIDNLLLSLSGTVRVAHCEQGQLAYRLDSLYQWSQRREHRFLEG